MVNYFVISFIFLQVFIVYFRFCIFLKTKFILLLIVQDTYESDSCEKMTNGDSPNVVCSSDDMTEDGNLPEDSGDEDMGDADSDDIYLEGFRSPDEMESEDDEEESDDEVKKLAYYEFEAYNYNQSLEALDKKAGGAEGKTSPWR